MYLHAQSTIYYMKTEDIHPDVPDSNIICFSSALVPDIHDSPPMIHTDIDTHTHGCVCVSMKKEEGEETEREEECSPQKLLGRYSTDILSFW